MDAPKKSFSLPTLSPAPAATPARSPDPAPPAAPSPVASASATPVSVPAAPAATAAAASASPPPTREELERRIIVQLRKVYDPELPVNIYDLGLIYAIRIHPVTLAVDITMTLTAPTCPVAGTLPGEVRKAAQAAPGVGPVNVELTWDPPWSRERLSEVARLQLGFDL